MSPQQHPNTHIQQHWLWKVSKYTTEGTIGAEAFKKQTLINIIIFIRLAFPEQFSPFGFWRVLKIERILERITDGLNLPEQSVSQTSQKRSLVPVNRDPQLGQKVQRDERSPSWSSSTPVEAIKTRGGVTQHETNQGSTNASTGCKSRETNARRGYFAMGDHLSYLYQFPKNLCRGKTNYKTSSSRKPHLSGNSAGLCFPWPPKLHWGSFSIIQNSPQRWTRDTPETLALKLAEFGSN